MQIRLRYNITLYSRKAMHTCISKGIANRWKLLIWSLYKNSKSIHLFRTYITTQLLGDILALVLRSRIKQSLRNRKTCMNASMKKWKSQAWNGTHERERERGRDINTYTSSQCKGTRKGTRQQQYKGDNKSIALEQSVAI